MARTQANVRLAFEFPASVTALAFGCPGRLSAQCECHGAFSRLVQRQGRVATGNCTMPSKRNIAILEDLLVRLSGKQMIITMRYSNVSAAQMDELRRAVRDGGGVLYIAKNTLVLRAAESLGIKGMAQIIDGPTGYVTVDGDVAVAAAALMAGIKEHNLPVEILGGVMEGNLIDAARVGQLSELPSRDELLGMLASSLSAPLTGLLRVMSAPVEGLAQSLRQVLEQRQAQEAG